MTEEEQTQEQNTEQTQEANTNGLIVIANGAVAASKPLNDNFSYLNSRADSLNQDITRVENELINSVGTKTEAFLNNAFYTAKILTPAESQGSIQLLENSITCLTTVRRNITFVLPAEYTPSGDTIRFAQMLVQVNVVNVGDIDGDRLGTTHFFDDIKPQFLSTGCYDIIYEFDGTVRKWFCSSIYKGVVSDEVSND